MNSEGHSTSNRMMSRKSNKKRTIRPSSPSEQISNGGQVLSPTSAQSRSKVQNLLQSKEPSSDQRLHFASSPEHKISVHDRESHANGTPPQPWMSTRYTPVQQQYSPAREKQKDDQEERGTTAFCGKMYKHLQQIRENKDSLVNHLD